MAQATVQQIFERAVALHNAGELIQAEGLYRQVLAAVPDHPDALHLLGQIALHCGNAPDAGRLIGQAARLRPRIAAYLLTLSAVQRAMGQGEEAVDTLRRAARLKPESAEIHHALGLALSAAGQGGAAAQAFRRAIARAPSMLAAHQALGAQMMIEGRHAAAAEVFRAAARVAPGDAEAWFNLGCALQQLEDLDGAAEHFGEALALRADYAQAANNLGVVLHAAGVLDRAEAALRHALAIDERAAAPWLNLGLVLRDASRFAEAEAAFRRSDALAPAAQTLGFVGNALRDQAAGRAGALADSEAVLRAALARDANDRESHIGLAFTLLLGGSWMEGWSHFAWRGAAAFGKARVRALTDAPAWRGQPLDGTLLVYAEQGAGDFFHMARYLPLAAARAGRVVVLAPAELQHLARGVAGVAEVLPPGAKMPPVEAVCADLDLPMLFGTTLETIPGPPPYLRADADAVAAWRARLAVLPGRKVGLAWAGNPAYGADRQRSVPAAALVGLAGVEGVTFVSLQPGAVAPAALGMADFSGELTDWAATAALIEALDLVIAVDSGVAHLAGALGREVWLLNRYAPDWRWLLGREDSPWYPSMRQFRQSTPGDWEAVLKTVASCVSNPMPEQQTRVAAPAT